MTGSAHDVAVTAWFQRVAQGCPVEALIQAFEDTFAAMWQRTQLTLGEVTLTAIVERVLHTATEQYPFLAAVEVEPAGLQCQRLRSEPALRVDQISAAIRFVLAEFLTVLGNLTAQILTPALHAVLSTVPGHASDSGASEDQA